MNFEHYYCLGDRSLNICISNSYTIWDITHFDDTVENAERSIAKFGSWYHMLMIILSSLPLSLYIFELLNIDNSLDKIQAPGLHSN